MKRYQIRVYDRSTAYNKRGGVCTELVHTNSDPYVFARRWLKLDEMREEGCGYTRAEIYTWRHDDFTRWAVWDLQNIVRITSKQRARWRDLGAVQRGVR